MTPDTIDLRGVPCPINSARAFVFLNNLASGASISFLIDPGEPFESLIDSINQENDYAIAETRQLNNHWKVNIDKA